MSNLRLSSKLDIIQPSASLAVAQRARELAQEGKDIISLSLGEPDFDVPAPIKAGLFQALEENKTHYTASQGVLEIRQELAKQIGCGVTPEQLILFSGCKLGIYLTLEAIVDPGDEIILIDPAWVSYTHMVTLAHGKPVSVSTHKENNFIPSIDEIKGAVTEKTKGIIVNNPNNPSGQLMPKELLDQIVELAREKEFFIIADEIYADILYDKDRFYSLINYDYERIIINSGFSKNFAMTGLRLGYAVASKEIIKAITKLHQHVGTCAPSMSQYSLLGRMEDVFNNDVEKMVSVYEKRKNLLIEGFKDTIFPIIVPQATFYMLLDISQLKMKSVEASTYLLEEFGVATVPGIGFGESVDDYVRISFATSEEQLKKAIERLQKVEAR